MIFANVTDIKISQGNVIKIHETNSRRVLWEKKDTPQIPVFEEGYPKIGVLIETSNYGNVWAGDSGILTPYINKWALREILVGWGDSGYSYAYPVTGAICTPYYFYNSTEAADPTNKGHLITDAKWGNSEIRYYPRTGGMTGPDYYVARNENVVRVSNYSSFSHNITFGIPSSFENARSQLISEGYSASEPPPYYSHILYKFDLLLSSVIFGLENRVIAEFGQSSSGA